MKLPKNLLIISFATVLMTSCANYSFIKTGIDETNFQPREKDAPVSIITSLPEDREYVEIGICKGTAPGGGLLIDETSRAIKQLKKCARNNGGNAILLTGDSESGFVTDWGESQETVKASGIVYYVYPKEE